MTTPLLDAEPDLQHPTRDVEPQRSARADRQPLLATLAIVLGAVAAAALLWSRRGYVPMWDGRIYADCVIDATRDLANVGGFRCAEHISHAYVALLAVAQWFAPASPAPMLAMNAALLALGAMALHRIARHVFPSPEHAVGRALVVAAFLVHPIILASAVQPGLDFGVLVFMLCALDAVLAGRRWLVVAFGLLLVFSKEPGVLVYGVIAALYLWKHGLRQRFPDGAWWLGVAGSGAALALDLAHGALLSSLLFAAVLVLLLRRRPAPRGVSWSGTFPEVMGQWMLALPVLAVVAYMASMALGHSHAAAAPGAPVVWANTGSSTLVATVFRAGVLDVSTLSVLALMLVIGFLWIPTVISAIDLAVAAMRRSRGAASRPLDGMSAEATSIVTAALLGCVWFLSRYQTYSNARYYLPVYPLALLVAYASLVRLGVGRPMRHATFAVLALLLGISAVRTVDPVSRALWGTFAVGDRAMLETTSLTGECCGAGRDQLVYNLEFTQFDALTSEALAVIHPTDATTIVVSPLGDWHTVGPVDARTGRRTLARQGVVTPQVVPAPVAYHFANELPDAWYLELPYLDNGEALRRLSERYAVSAPARVEHDGYGMDVRRLRLRRAER